MLMLMAKKGEGRRRSWSEARQKDVAEAGRREAKDKVIKDAKCVFGWYEVVVVE